MKVKIELWMKSFSLGIKCKSNIREQEEQEEQEEQQEQEQEGRRK